MKNLKKFLLGTLAVLCAAAFVACEEDDPTLAGNDELVVTTPTGNDTLGMYRKPAAVSASLVYSGDTVRLTLAHFVDSVMTVTGSAGLNAGDYTCIVALKDTARYVWSDSTKDTVRIAWKITPAPLNQPEAAVVAYKHTGSEITLSLLHLDTARMTVSGSAATAAGDYECRIALKDPLNYMWNSGTAADVVIAWRITEEGKTLIVKPSMTGYFYGTTYVSAGTAITGNPLYPVGFDTATMSIEGNVCAGPGVALFSTVALKDKDSYAWADETNEDLTVELIVYRDMPGGYYELTQIMLEGDTIEVRSEDWETLLQPFPAGLGIARELVNKLLGARAGWMTFNDMTAIYHLDYFHGEPNLIVFENNRIDTENYYELEFDPLTEAVFNNLFFINNEIRFVYNGAEGQFTFVFSLR